MNWKNKNVLVTGADGFIGSHLVEKLVQKGARLKAFVYYNAFNSWGWLESIPKSTLKKVDIFSGDIRDPNGVLKVTKDVDIIFHLAALIGIPFSYHSPDSNVDTNIKGTLNVLQAARKWKVSKIIHTSTSEVYGTAQYVPIDEEHPIKTQSPYAATKSAADALAISFYRSFGLPVTIARPFNTFGPRQSARAIIPTIITQCYSGRKTIALGNLNSTRDFNYVSNVIDGFISIAQTDKTNGDVFNIGSGTEISIKELVTLIQDIIKSKCRVVIDKRRFRPRKSEVEQLLCDAKKIKETCGWCNKISLREGLKLTCKWMKEHLKTYKSEIYNI